MNENENAVGGRGSGSAQDQQQPLPPIATPASQPVLLKIVRVSLLFIFALLILSALVGYACKGMPGLWGGLIGAALGGVCMLLSSLSIVVANKFVANDMFVPIFFASVLGSLLLKMVLFVVAVLFLRSQEWLEPRVLFIALVAGVLGALVIDLVTVLRNRMPAVSDVRMPH